MNGLIQKFFFATGCIFELARGVILFAVVLALINVFVVTLNIVNGASMEPNFHDKQYVLVDRLSFYLRAPERGEPVIVKFPGDPEKVRYIKRIIGLPGETVEIDTNVVTINGKVLHESYIPADFQTLPNGIHELGPEEYFLMGDNRENSNDSRVFGPVERRFFVGKAYFILIPFGDAGLVSPEFYTIDPI